jgi:hypothetical protein
MDRDFGAIAGGIDRLPKNILYFFLKVPLNIYA